MSLSILFWLRASAKNSKGYAPLLVRLTLPNNDIANFSTGMKCDINLWNPVKKAVSGNGEEAKRLNLYISRSITKLNDIYSDLQREERDISAEIIKNIFNGKLQQRITILGAISDHNEKFKAQMEATGKGEQSTIDKFVLLSDKLTKFMSLKFNRKDYFVNEIDHGFLSDFRSWLLMYGHKDGTGLAPDSATGHLKKLNKITTNLFKRSLMKIDPFVDIPLSWQDSTAEGLNETDLEKIEKVKLTLPRLQRVQDRFIVGCYSGMAHSDISKCTRDDLVTNFGSEGVWIKTRRKKTGEYCKILILPPVQAIIDKYWNDPKCVADNKLFPTVGLQCCNDYLKEIAVFAGVNMNVSTHTARHTFAQMALDLGVDIEAIAEILGHASSKTTKSTYAKMSHVRVASEMKNFTDKKFPVLKIVQVEEEKKIS